MGFDRGELERTNRDHWERMKSLQAELMKRAPEEQAAWDERDRVAMEKTLGVMSTCRRSLGLSPQARVALDVGAGKGRAKEPLMRVFDCDYVGIEVLEDKPLVTGVESLALEECPKDWHGRFDVVYANHVLEHCQDPALALAALKHLLAADGVLGVVTPHLMPDPEPAHVNVLTAEQWFDAWREWDLLPLYLEYEMTTIPELRMVLCHRERYPRG